MTPRLLAGLSLVLLTGCGLKPAQDYVVTGTLDLPAPLKARFEQLQRSRGSFELVMTARTSPSIGDVVVQRRWKHVVMPFEFGLGKGRGAALASRGEGVYVTARLESKVAGLSFAAAGFTPREVPVGTHHIQLVLEHDPADEAIYRLPGAPRNGWESRSVVEEAPPPTRDAPAASGPGPMAYAGRIRVPADLADSLDGWTLFVMARERAERGFPELILPYRSPRFPLDYSLHQLHRQAGGTDPITDPKFVIALLDRDGVPDTKEDQIVVTTDSKLPIGSEGVDFDIPGKELRAILARRPTSAPTSRPSSRPASRPANGTTGKDVAAPTPVAGALVAEGTIVLPKRLEKHAEGAVLWISVRDGRGGSSVIMKRVAAPSFPFRYEMRNGEGEMRGSVPAGAEIMVRAILTKTGPLDRDALSGMSRRIAAGDRGVDIQLEEPGDGR